MDDNSLPKNKNKIANLKGEEIQQDHKQDGEIIFREEGTGQGA